MTLSTIMSGLIRENGCVSGIIRNCSQMLKDISGFANASRTFSDNACRAEVWDRVSNREGEDLLVYRLEAGEHILVIQQREDGTKIDWVLITNDMKFVPEE
jgi:hypothetical protein